jgi:hypothetical protein
MASEVAIERKQRNRRWFIILGKPPSQADLKEFYASSVPESTKTNRGTRILHMIHSRHATLPPLSCFGNTFTI